MFDHLSKYIVYPTYWNARGLNVLGLRNPYEKAQWLSQDELEQIQWKALGKLLAHAYQNVPFYRSRFNAIGMHPEDIRTREEFTSLPYLTKNDINTNLTDLVARNYSSADMVRDSTGGSTGKNITFFEDKMELSHRFAAALRSDSWAGLHPGDRYVQIWGSPMDFNKGSFLRRKLDTLLLRRLFISSFDLSDADLLEVLQKIRRYKPKVLIGYPTPLHRLSKFVKDHTFKDLGLMSIIASSETLYDYQRQEIEDQLTAKIYNRYGCREFGPIATECEQGGLHVIADRLYVEYIDASPDERLGDFKEIVVTDLHKYGMPFIRYKIGDIGIPSDAMCACGRGLPLMKQIEGRTFDMVIGTNNNFVAGTFWTLLFRSISGIEMFQVHQTAQDKLHINLVVNKQFTNDSISTLNKMIFEKCGADMKIYLEIVPEIPVSASGKRRFVISDVAREYFSQ